MVLAVAGIVVFHVDRTVTYADITVGFDVLLLFAVYSAAVFLAPRVGWRLRPATAAWVDVAWASLLISVSGGTSSIFFPVFLFAVLCASFHGGTRRGLAALAGSVLAFVVVGGVTAPGGKAFELDRTLIRPLYLLVLGYLMSAWGGHARRTRARLALLREVLSLSNPRFGVEHAVTRLLARLRSFFDAASCRLVVADVADGRTWTRASARSRPEPGPAMSLPPPLDRTLLPDTSGAALLWRGARFRPGDASRIVETFDVSCGAAVPGGAVPLARALPVALEARSFVAIPFRYDAEAPGLLYLTADRRGAFDTSDVEFLAHLVQQVLPILDNIRLLDRLAVNVAGAERRKIARDLHDSVIQPYVGLRLGLAGVRQALAAGRPEAALALVDRLSDAADAEVQGLRGFMDDLRTTSGDAPRAPLPEAVNGVCDRFSAATGIRVHAATEGDVNVDGRVATEVIHMVGEALSNVRRHAGASQANVRIAAGLERIRVEIEDDGPADGAARDFSPRSLAERAAALGGRLDVVSTPGSTALRIEIPL